MRRLLACVPSVGLYGLLVAVAAIGGSVLVETAHGLAELV